MTLLGAKEDFLRYTLGNIPGLWGRLEYVASLRTGDGSYGHWGLARVYGESAVQRVLADTHRAIFMEVLETPLERLVREAARSAEELDMAPREFVRRLAEAPMIIPAQLGGGNVRHFNSVLACLSALGREERIAIGRAS